MGFKKKEMRLKDIHDFTAKEAIAEWNNPDTIKES